MNRTWYSAFVVAALIACGAPDAGAEAGARGGAETGTGTDAGATPRAEATTDVAGGTQGGAGGSEVIRDVRVNPGTTTVEITFTSVPGAFASIVIGPTPPQSIPLPPTLASETGRTSVLLLDPERQVAGYLVRSRTASYALDTARDQPEEGSTNGPSALRPGTTYHFIISAPTRAPRPGEDEDDVPMAAQHSGSFTTRR